MRLDVRPLCEDGPVSGTAAVVALPHGRVPPHNLDAERSLLGGVLLDNQAFPEVLEHLKAEDFYRDAHRKIFEAMCELFGKSQPIDRITVKDALTRSRRSAATSSSTCSIRSSPPRPTSSTTRRSSRKSRWHAG